MPFKPKERLAWAGLILFSLVARLSGLGLRAMSHDESLHAVYSRYWVNGLSYHHDPMLHGPFLFHLNGFLDLFLPDTDVYYRLAPALFGVGSVAMLLLYRRWLGPRGAWWTAALISVEPSLLFYSRYLRNDIYIVCFTLLMGWAILRYRESGHSRYLLALATGLGLSFVTKEVCFIHGAVFGSACLGFAARDALQNRGTFGSLLLQHPLTQCAVLMLCLALPFASPLLQPDLPWDRLAQQPPTLQRQILAAALVVLGVGASAGTVYFSTLGRRKSFLQALGIFWGLQGVFYSTLFTHTLYGLASGVGGSLGYWLAQHDVERGNSHPLFYLSLLLLYAPVLLSGLVYGLRKRKTFPTVFFLFWAIGNLLIYSWAGERMPWLLTHITLPLCLLTGPLLAKLWQTSESKPRWLLRGLLGLGLVQMTFNSFLASGPHAEGATEPLVYAHSGPQIKTAMRLIEEQLALHPGSIGVMDHDFTWPMYWYFQKKPVYGYDLETADIPSQASVLLAPVSERTRWTDQGWTGRLEVDMTTWPRPQYHELSMKNLQQLIRNPSTRKKLLPYLLYRGQPPWGPYEFPGPHRFLLLTRSPE